MSYDVSAVGVGRNFDSFLIQRIGNCAAGTRRPGSWPCLEYFAESGTRRGCLRPAAWAVTRSSSKVYRRDATRLQPRIFAFVHIFNKSSI